MLLVLRCGLYVFLFRSKYASEKISASFIKLWCHAEAMCSKHPVRSIIGFKLFLNTASLSSRLRLTFLFSKNTGMSAEKKQANMFASFFTIERVHYYIKIFTIFMPGLLELNMSNFPKLKIIVSSLTAAIFWHRICIFQNFFVIDEWKSMISIFRNLDLFILVGFGNT